jgi:tetratricopeptide (TPR) repeat protein
MQHERIYKYFSNTSINYISEENIPEESINNVNEPNSVCNINRDHIVLAEEGSIKYLTGNHREALLLYKEAISDLKGQLATFPCRKLAVLFGNMSECYMQLDDIEQSYKAAVTCVRYDPKCYEVCYYYDFINRLATKLQSAYALTKGGWAYVSLSSLTR